MRIRFLFNCCKFYKADVSSQIFLRKATYFGVENLLNLKQTYFIPYLVRNRPTFPTIFLFVLIYFSTYCWYLLFKWLFNTSDILISKLLKYSIFKLLYKVEFFLRIYIKYWHEYDSAENCFTFIDVLWKQKKKTTLFFLNANVFHLWFYVVFVHLVFKRSFTQLLKN